jgi:hypothetical protein
LSLQLRQHPGPQRGFQRHRIDLLQDPPKRRLVRHRLADAERGQHRHTGVVGVLGDRGERPRPGQYRARPEQQHREHTMADPPRLTGIRHFRQRFYQR